MDWHAEWDGLTVEVLRDRGGLKWGRYPQSLGGWVAEMDFGTSPAVIEMLGHVTARREFGYLGPAAEAAVREATADWSARRYGWDLAPEQVHVIGDVIEGVRLAITHFSPPDSPVILPTPAYMPFFEVPETVGRDLIEVPMATTEGRSTFDLEAIDQAFASGGHALILCSPYNPLGRVFAADELSALADVVDHRGGRVVSDEIHAPLVYAGHRHIPYASLSPTTAAHTLTVVSPSKGWNLPGLKSAQMIVSNDEDAATWQSLGVWPAHGASTPGVWSSVAAYGDTSGWLDAVVAYLDGNRRYLADLLAAKLPQVGYRMPEGTYLAWLDVRTLDLPEDAAAHLRSSAGLAVVDGAACHGPGHLRLNFATSRPILEQMVSALATVAQR